MRHGSAAVSSAVSVLLLLSVVALGGCASAPEAAHAPVHRAIGRIEACTITRAASGALVPHLLVRFDGSTVGRAGSWIDDVTLELVPDGGPLPGTEVPVVVADEPGTDLGVGTPVRRASATGELDEDSHPLTPSELASSAVVVPSQDPNDPRSTLRVAFYLDRFSARVTPGEHAVLEEPHTCTLEPPAGVVPTPACSGPSDPDGGSFTGAGEMLANALGDLCSLFGRAVLCVLAVPLVPVAILALLIYLGAGGSLRMPSGRAFRVRGKARTPRAVPGTAWAGETRPYVGALAPEARETLAAEWLRDAGFEHASIAAFSRLSLDLVALGAPPALVEGAHRAALDEVRHAKACYALASAYAGRELSAGPFPAALTQRASGGREGELVRLATEALEDGCLDEGFAAQVAGEAAVRAGDAAVRGVLAMIAREEARHAALGWDVLAWSLEVGGEGVRTAVERRLARLPRARRIDAPRATADLVAHGRLGPEEQARLFERTSAAVRERAAALLAGPLVTAA